MTGYRKTLTLMLAAVAVLAPAARACQTPVFKYALLNWGRDPILVLYFHRGKVDRADAGVNEWLARLADDPRINLEFAAVDVGKIDKLPEDALPRVLLKEKTVTGFPRHVVLSTTGTILFRGRLTPLKVYEMVWSPAARHIATTLSKGEKALLVLLLGKDAAANATAEAAFKKGLAEAGKHELDAHTMTVRTDDPNSTWLVRQLLSVEKDLPEKAKKNEPMIFAVIGRGMILRPYVGKGITEDGMMELLDFLNGPCSCQVKEELQGASGDLLTNLDWEAAIPQEVWAAENLPQEDEYFQATLQEVGPPETSPGGQTPTTAEATQPGGAVVRAAPGAGQSPAHGGSISFIVLIAVAAVVGVLVIAIVVATWIMTRRPRDA